MGGRQQWTWSCIFMLLCSGPASGSCGLQNQNVASSITDARQHSMFVFAYEDPNATPPDLIKAKDGTHLQFVGNSFLIDTFDNGADQTGYFATAKHNLLIACQGAAAGTVPKIWMIAPSGVSIKVEGPSQALCNQLVSTYDQAKATDVIFDPDFLVLKASLPGGIWLPLMVGSGTSAGSNGGVEHLNASLTAQPTPVVALPSPASQRPEYASFSWLRAIAGNNEHGVSGSPFVATVEGQRPVVLGLLTNSIPPSGAPLLSSRQPLSAQEVANLIASMQPQIAATGYSLIATFDVLQSEYDPKAVDPAILSIFAQAQGKSFRNMDMADRIRRRLVSSGLSSLVYLRQQCTTMADGEKPNMQKIVFCAHIFLHADNVECFYGPDDFEQFTTDTVDKMNVETGTIFNGQGAAIKAANDARPLVNKAGQHTAATIAVVLKTALDHPHQGNLVGQRWDSATLYDLALAERKATGDDKSYLRRLKQSIQIDPKNNIAKRAFVDAAVQRAVLEGDTADLSVADRYLGDLTRTGAIPAALAERTAKDSKAAVDH